jgi:hypothetical protein
MTFRERGEILWEGEPLEPQALAYEGDQAPERRDRLVGGWLTIERRTSTPLIPPDPSPLYFKGDESARWYPYSHGGVSEPHAHQVIFYSSEPADWAVAGLLRYRTFHNPSVFEFYSVRGDELTRGVQVVELSLWPVAVALGIWPVLDLLRRVRRRRTPAFPATVSGQ